MANPMREDKALFEKIKKEHIIISPDIWEIIYKSVGDNITTMNFIVFSCINENKDINKQDANVMLECSKNMMKIFDDIIHSKEVATPNIIKQLFCHYISNDLYSINLIIGNSLDPKFPEPLTVENAEKISLHTESMMNFLKRINDTQA